MRTGAAMTGYGNDPGPCYRCGAPAGQHVEGRCPAPALRRGPSHHSGKFPGVGFIIAGIALWLITGQLVSTCRADMNPLTGSGVCSGLPAIAYHAQPTAMIGAIVLALIGVIILITQ